MNKLLIAFVAATTVSALAPTTALAQTYDPLAQTPFVSVTSSLQAPETYARKHDLSEAWIVDTPELVLRRNRVLLEPDREKWSEEWSPNPRFHVILHVVEASNGSQTLAIFNLSAEFLRKYFTKLPVERDDGVLEWVDWWVESQVRGQSALQISEPEDVSEQATVLVKDLAENFAPKWLRSNPQWVQ